MLLGWFVIAKRLIEISGGYKSLLLDPSWTFVEAVIFFFFTINYTSLAGGRSFPLSEIPQVMDDFRKRVGTEKPCRVPRSGCLLWMRGEALVLFSGLEALASGNSCIIQRGQKASLAFQCSQ